MLRISDTLHHELPRQDFDEETPHTCSPPETFSPAAPQFAWNLVDSFDDASTAVRLDALQFNTSRMVKRISIKLSGVFRLVGLGLITISFSNCRPKLQGGSCFLVALTAYER